MNKMSVKDIAKHLGLKERKVKKIIRIKKERRLLSAASKPQLRDKKKNYLNILGIILLCCLGIIMYSNTLHSPFQFDDEFNIINIVNIIKSFSNLNIIFNFFPTRFITYLSLAINYHFNQLDVFGYHLFNLIVHLSTSIMVWWFVLLTLHAPALRDKKISGYSNIIAFFAALVFISHPIQTQGVTYIIQRAASLATLFYVSSLAFYVKSRLLKYEANKSNIRTFYYILSFMALILAMFTKEMTITLPLMILLYEFCFFKEEDGVDWKHLTPFLVALLIIPITMAITKSVNLGEMRLSTQESPGFSPWNYLLTQFRVIIAYIRLLFLPINQNLDYDYIISRSLFNITVLSSIFILVLILITAIRIFPKYRLISFGIFWFFLTLLPESSIIPIKDIIFEHRLYLPMTGFSIFLVSVIYYIFENKSIKPAIAIISIVTVTYSILTYNRNFIWKDEFTLWNDTAHKSPNKARPFNNRGHTYEKRGNLDQAISDYNRALEIDPNYSDAYLNRGNAYQKRGNLAQAIPDYNKIIEMNPNYFKAYNSRGVAYQKKGNLDAAISDYSKALELNSDFPDAYNNRANAYRNKGNFDGAILDCNKAIEIYPKYTVAYFNRALAYQDKGNLDAAISDYSKVLELDPNNPDAYNDRANTYQEKGNLDQAILDYNKAIEINPKHTEAYNNRAVAYLKKKEYANSWEDVRSAQALGYKVNPELIEELKNTEK